MPTIPYENESVVCFIGAGDGQSRTGDCKTKADDILDLIIDRLETDPTVKAHGYESLTDYIPHPKGSADSTPHLLKDEFTEGAGFEIC